MRYPSWIAALLGLGFLGMGLPAQALDLNGEWRGRGNAVAGDCPGFVISVSVHDSKLFGTALQGEQDYAITGYITNNGELRGEVSYMFWTIAELSGEMTRGQATGTWRTFKGPKCNGQFVAQKFQGQPAAAENLAEAY